MQHAKALADGGRGNLAGDEQHARAAGPGCRQTRQGVQHTRPWYNHAHAFLAGAAGITVGHIGRCLLMARNDVLDVGGGIAQGIHRPVQLHSRDAEQDLDAFAPQLFDQGLSAGGHPFADPGGDWGKVIALGAKYSSRP